MNASAKKLFVLGRLSMRPTHGHEIMRTLAASRSDLWAELSEKHVYYILRELEREGFVRVEQAASGGRASRKVYALTDLGSAEFERLLRSEALVGSIPYSEFDVVFGMLAYTDRLSGEEKLAVLERRAEHLRALIATAREAGGAAASSGAPGLPTRLFTKVACVAQSELCWLEDVMLDLRQTGWPPYHAQTAHPTEGDTAV